MKFKDAKKLLKRGKEVRRKAWGAMLSSKTMDIKDFITE